MLFLQVMIIVIFGAIAHQDFKYRAVLWLLFPLVAILLAILFLQHIGIEHFFLFSGVNILLVSLMLLLLWSYTKYFMKQKFLNNAFGLGDVLMLYAFALGFPTVTFIILLVGSLCFSLTVYLAIRFFRGEETIPLAGLIGVYLILILICSNLLNFPSLYVI